jgi:hypothetical protein
MLRPALHRGWVDRSHGVSPPGLPLCSSVCAGATSRALWDCSPWPWWRLQRRSGIGTAPHCPRTWEFAVSPRAGEGREGDASRLAGRSRPVSACPRLGSGQRLERDPPGERERVDGNGRAVGPCATVLAIDLSLRAIRRSRADRPRVLTARSRCRALGHPPGAGPTPRLEPSHPRAPAPPHRVPAKARRPSIRAPRASSHPDSAANLAEPPRAETQLEPPAPVPSANRGRRLALDVTELLVDPVRRPARGDDLAEAPHPSRSLLR